MWIRLKCIWHKWVEPSFDYALLLFIKQIWVLIFIVCKLPNNMFCSGYAANLCFVLWTVNMLLHCKTFEKPFWTKQKQHDKFSEQFCYQVVIMMLYYAVNFVFITCFCFFSFRLSFCKTAVFSWKFASNLHSKNGKNYKKGTNAFSKKRVTNGIWTHDLLIMRNPLYQLSYSADLLKWGVSVL